MCAPRLNYAPMPEARKSVREERFARQTAIQQDDFNKGFGKTKFEDTRDDSLDFVIGATTGLPMPSAAGMMGAAAHSAFTSVEDSDKSYTPSDSSNSSFGSSDYSSGSSSSDYGSSFGSSSGGFGD